MNGGAHWLKLAPSAALAVVLALAAGGARSDSTASAGIFGAGHVASTSGEVLYQQICQGCHMPDGRGASGAGHYPALAANPKLEAAGYPLTVVLHGLNGMPPVGQMMSDAQVAQVVNYVRTHFGNNYTDAVKPEDVKALR